MPRDAMTVILTEKGKGDKVELSCFEDLLCAKLSALDIYCSIRKCKLGEVRGFA